MVSGKSDLIEVAAIIHHETDNAFLVDHGGEKKYGFPKANVKTTVTNEKNLLPRRMWKTVYQSRTCKNTCRH